MNDEFEDRMREYIEGKTKRSVYISTCSVADEQAPPALTSEMLRGVMKKLSSPPRVSLSKYAPALGTVPAPATPHTDDMRHMLDDIGEVKVPIAIVMMVDGHKTVIVNPVNLQSLKPKTPR